MNLRIGDTVGDYTIIGPLGRGGMGQVFRVEHNITKRQEAMKILAAHPLEGAEPASRFLREIKIHASLNHPNIVTLHNAFLNDQDILLVMELVEGESLRKRLDRGRLPLQFGVRCIAQILAGLGYAHQHGIIHRDISPSNIIVDENGPAKLMDFGLSKAVAEPSLVQSGAALGSVYHCSPEQVKGSTNLDARSDIYSVGAVLYEVITGRKLFEADSAFSIMLDHVQTQPTPPAEVDPNIPVALSDIVMKALAKDPRERYQSVDEFREGLLCALEELAAAVAIPAVSSSSRRRLQLAFAMTGVLSAFLVLRAAVFDRPVAQLPSAITWPAAPELVQPVEAPMHVEESPAVETSGPKLQMARQKRQTPKSQPLMLVASHSKPEAMVAAKEPDPEEAAGESEPSAKDEEQPAAKPKGLHRIWSKVGGVLHLRKKPVDSAAL